MSSSLTTLTPEQSQAALRALLEGPAMSPPAGVISNFHDPPNLDVFVILTIVLCATFATLAVLLRMYTKIFIIRALAWEDYVIVLAWIGEFITSGIVTRYGGGRHMWDVQLQTFFKMLYWINVSAIVYGFVVFFIKLSILLQYLRIFAPTRKGNMFMYVGAHLCIWSNLLFYFVGTVFEIALCTPRKRIWNPLMTTGHCFSLDATFQAAGVINCFSDFAILILPMPCIWRLHMPLRKKLLMMTVFAIGLFACITSILRTYYTWKITQSDISYNMVLMGLWTEAELCTGIIISCFPVTTKFFSHIGPKLSNAFTLKFTKDSNKESASAASLDRVRVERLKLPSLKHTFTSIISSTSTEKDDGHELYSQQTLPKGEYVQLDEDMVISRRDAIRDSIQKPAAKVATTSDDLDGGYAVF